MGKRLIVVNAVGLTTNLIDKETTPNLSAFQYSHHLKPPLPAVTCTSQATLMTGSSPQEHGIVANGWYFRELSQVSLWKQSFQLLQKKTLIEELKEKIKTIKIAKSFWWFNMYSPADYSVTPRPIYRANGSKYPDTYTYPMELNDELKEKFGTFPLFNFWGPNTSIKSSKWITDVALYINKKYNPDLHFVYLPHLDYVLQKFGPNAPEVKKDLKELDKLIGEITAYAKNNDYEVMVLSEYGITEVDQPIHINRLLRENNFIQVKEECGEEHFDAGASDAFAVADHQIAHIYINNKKREKELIDLLKKQKGIAKIYVGDEKKDIELNHPRSGEIVCLANPNAWFTYYYWLDNKKAPDFARCVDIHRKPGYDPVELFLTKGGKLKVAKNLILKKLGMRYLMDVIPLDGTLVKGSHGVQIEELDKGPLLLSSFDLKKDSVINMEEFPQIVKKFYSIS